MKFQRVILTIGLAMVVVGTALAAVTTVTSTSYALRPCSTCKEVAYPTEAQCIAAGQAEAVRIGETRTTGSAVYTCVVRHNVIATFRAGPPPTPQPSGTATLSWTPPTRNTDGSALTNLVGHRIHYGQSATALSQTIQVANPGVVTYPVNNLTPGTWYFAVRAYNAAGGESDPSNTIAKVIP